MSYRQTLASQLKEKLGLDFFPEVSPAPRLDMGDYATNLAFKLAETQKKGQSPNEIAKTMVAKIRAIEGFESPKAVNGFINFRLKKEELFDFLAKRVLSGDLMPQKIGKGKKVVVDYSSPNIAKPFSVGHLRSTVLGDVTLKLHKALGFQVIGINHLGDWGTQFGNLIVAIKKFGKKLPLTIENLNALYVKFHQGAAKDPKLFEEGRRAFLALEWGDKKIRALWRKIVTESLKEFSRIYEKLGIKIDYTLGESFYETHLPALLEELKAGKIAIKSQGAWVIPLDKEIPPAMVQKADGATLYFTRDLAALRYRISRFKPARIIYHVGREQELHFRQLFLTAQKMGLAKNSELIFAGHGLMHFKGIKISTRKGHVILLDEMIKEAIKRALKLLEEKNPKLSQKEKKKASEVLGVGAIKYTQVSQNRLQDVQFDWDKMLTLKGNSIAYFQYAYVRTLGLKRRALGFDEGFQKSDFETLSPLGIDLLRETLHFEEVAETAAKEVFPHFLTDFLFRLAASFNHFYEKERIVEESHLQETRARLALTNLVELIFKKGLEILGVEPLTYL